MRGAFSSWPWVMPLLVLTLRAAAWASSARQVVELKVALEEIHRVDPRFLSVTIDASLAADPKYIAFLGSQRLRTLANNLTPAYLRFGGTQTDFLLFSPKKHSSWEEKLYWQSTISQDLCAARALPSAVEKMLQAQWVAQEQLLLKENFQKKYKNTTISKSTVDMIYSFANCSGLDLIFGLNALLRKQNSQWDSSNAQLLLSYCASQHYNLSWELGNEPNSFRKKAGIYIDGSQLGKDFVSLHDVLSQFSSFRYSGLFGPDVGQPRTQSQKLLMSFLNVGGKVIDSVTWHQYYVDGRTAAERDFLDPDVLDSLIQKIQQVLQIVDEIVPLKKVWLGETSSAYGGGAPGLSNTYLDGFMWLDKLGLSAKLGINVVMRQAFFGTGSYNLVDSNFDPLPDYWLSLLHKKLVGTQVLNASVSDMKGVLDRKVRVYLHCTNSNNPKYQVGDVTLFALNLHNGTRRVQLPDFLAKRQIDEYLIQPVGGASLLSRTVQLNGKVLKMVDDRTLPPLAEKSLAPGSLLELPAFTYGFYVLKNAKAPACIDVSKMKWR
ncbi:heparanase [Ambystoma mexicanum]|uniref:heparanase n=1 Tax=Ambystoma mexicanum TaxID=8296 RepID=UPI0037E8EF30